ncbi:MAG: hypothetical protein Q9183_006812 [Haloplaca sp. 2 TL-2023]
MASGRSFYEATKACRPESVLHTNKSNSVTVAILKPDQVPDGPKSDDNYLWIKCFGKTTADKLYAQCKLKNGDDRAFVLLHGARVIPSTMPMSEIVTLPDGLVALQQINEVDYSARLTPSKTLTPSRQPLQQIE